MKRTLATKLTLAGAAAALALGAAACDPENGDLGDPLDDPLLEEEEGDL